MIKRQQRIARISAVLQEHLAAKTASDLLTAQTNANPSYGRDHGWEPRAGVAFTDNLEATYFGSNGGLGRSTVRSSRPRRLASC
jgi:hypothetical protein